MGFFCSFAILLFSIQLFILKIEAIDFGISYKNSCRSTRQANRNEKCKTFCGNNLH